MHACAGVLLTRGIVMRKSHEISRGRIGPGVKLRTSHIIAVVAAASLLCAPACSSDPDACNDKGSYAGSEGCEKMKRAFDAKCSAQNLSFNCDKYLEAASGGRCSSRKRLCAEGVDQA